LKKKTCKTLEKKKKINTKINEQKQKKTKKTKKKACGVESTFPMPFRILINIIIHGVIFNIIIQTIILFGNN